MQIPASAKPVLETLEKAGFEAYVVGGAVRDLLLKRPAKDVDIATNARPEQVCRLFPHTIETGIQHGTVTVMYGNQGQFEVTTFRSDGPYLDNRRPLYVTFSNKLEDDLARRDFTMNALALASDGTLHDPFGGWNDLQQGVLRAVGVADERFQEDALRMLRALRFASSYQLTMDSHTRQALERRAPLIGNVSKERIGQELWKLSLGPWERSIEVLAETRLWASMMMPFTHLATAFNTLKSSPIAQVTGDSNHLLRSRVPLRQADAFAAWFVFVLDGAEIVHRICKAGALGRDVARFARNVCQLTKSLLDRLEKASKNPYSPVISPRELYDYGMDVANASFNLLGWLAPESHEQRQAAYAELRDKQPLWGVNELAVNGSDLQQLGLHGPAIGHAIRRLVEDVVEGRVANEQKALICSVKDWIQDEIIK